MALLFTSALLGSARRRGWEILEPSVSTRAESTSSGNSCMTGTVTINAVRFTRLHVWVKFDLAGLELFERQVLDEPFIKHRQDPGQARRRPGAEVGRRADSDNPVPPPAGLPARNRFFSYHHSTTLSNPTADSAKRCEFRPVRS